MNTAHLALDIYRTQATHTYIDFFFFFLFFLLLFFLLRVAHYVTVRDTYGCVSCVLATTHSQRVSCLCHICTRQRIEVSVPDWDRSDIRADGANPFTNKFFPPWCVLLRSRLGSEKKKGGIWRIPCLFFLLLLQFFSPIQSALLVRWKPFSILYTGKKKKKKDLLLDSFQHFQEKEGKIWL